MSKKLTPAEVIQQFEDKHKNTYDYSLVDYKDKRISVDIICPIHGKFEQTPIKHLLGRGCKECGSIKQSKSKIETASKKFIAEADLLHDKIYDYSFVEYKKATLPVKVKCKVHGIFEITPNKHLNKNEKRGCQKCGWERCEKIHTIETYRNKKTILYYIKVDNNFKIGLTMRNNTLSRYSKKEQQKITVLHEWEYMDGSIAFELEQLILHENKQSKYKGKKILDSGNTELFNTDIYENIIALIE